jgi:hypothetical protein
VLGHTTGIIVDFVHHLGGREIESVAHGVRELYAIVLVWKILDQDRAGCDMTEKLLEPIVVASAPRDVECEAAESRNQRALPPGDLYSVASNEVPFGVCLVELLRKDRQTIWSVEAADVVLENARSHGDWMEHQIAADETGVVG